MIQSPNSTVSSPQVYSDFNYNTSPTLMVWLDQNEGHWKFYCKLTLRLPGASNINDHGRKFGLRTVKTEDTKAVMSS